jgi:hypothetical protein
LAEQGIGFSEETVPDYDAVFMRAHKSRIANGALTPSVFTAHDRGMSVDWCKYANPEQTKARARKPQDNAVIEMNVGHIRSIPTLDVLHTPQPDNQSHCDVPLPDIEEDLTEARFKLRSIAKIIIPLDLQPLNAATQS